MRFLLLLAVIGVSLTLVFAATPSTPDPVQFLGPQGWYMPDLSVSRPEKRDPVKFCPPRKAITRQDYLAYVRPYAKGFEAGSNHGQYGPRHCLPALAVFAVEGDVQLGEGIKQTLKHYADWVQKSVKETGGVSSLEGSYLCALHFRELRKRGLMNPDDEQWVKTLLLNLCKYEYAWEPKDGLWRGPHHRSQGQGCAHALAAVFYPNESDAAAWKAYADTVWGDWWNYRDIGINDTGYFFGSLNRIMLTAELLGRKEVFTDPDVREMLWKRLLYEVTPDGAVAPYGAHGGYNSLAGERILALELVAKYTRDGRYRWVAQRLMNYGQMHGFAEGHNHNHAVNIESLALASLLSDDTIAPVEPDGGSQLLTRKEVIRLTNDQVKKQFPGYGGVDCNMIMTQKLMPAKLAFRAGWKPGDLFMLVECYARHDPLNPTAILGMERYSSAFAMPTYEKFVSRENAVKIEDLSGNATYLGEKHWKKAKEPPLGWAGMTVAVPDFSDHALASHAIVHVTNYMGFNATQDREFLFIKNRFVLVRDVTTFDDTFKARVGPVWNTQNIGPTTGAHWLNTWFTAHWYQHIRLYDNPPWQLLVYHAPHADRKLSVRNRTGEDWVQDVPYSTRYAWEGNVEPGSRVQFVQVLLPHAVTETPEALASAIEVLRDEPGLAAVTVTGDDGKEWALLNTDGDAVALTPKKPGAVKELTTDARRLYLQIGTDAKVKRLLILDGTFVALNGTDIFRKPERADHEYVAKAPSGAVKK